MIKSRPIRGGLNDFRNSYNTTQTDIPELSNVVGYMHIDDKGLKNLMIDLILDLQNLPAAHLLPSLNGHKVFHNDLLWFFSLVVSNDFNIRLVISLLNKVLDKASDIDI
ncbi:MAG: hypothetical protein M1840_000695 [Geoglossum simile]|nr:MAG: hypothetical protein M1840_000695 [Geoglossum simile]